MGCPNKTRGWPRCGDGKARRTGSVSADTLAGNPQRCACGSTENVLHAVGESPRAGPAGFDERVENFNQSATTFFVLLQNVSELGDEPLDEAYDRSAAIGS